MGGAPMSSTKPVASPEDAFLQPTDGVAISFRIISIGMIASTVFFLAEAATVGSHWRTSLHVGSLVTLVAGVHYMYMREYWVQVHKSPIVYRYVDWSITVPLQMIEFNLILKAAGKPTTAAGFCGWGFILFEVFSGEAGSSLAGCSEAVMTSFKNMRLIVTVGWSIYPLGYLFGSVSDDALNITYNIADFINKIAFVLSCWACAKSDSAGKVGALLG